MNKKILITFTLLTFILSVNTVFASNTVSVTPNTYIDVSGNIYNSSFSKTDGTEQDYDVYGTNLPLYGQVRNIEYFNSTVGYDAQVDGIEHPSNPFIVESGPVRVLIHGENTSNIPLSDINCDYNYSIDVYAYPKYYFVNYKDWGNFTQIRPNGNAFRMYEFDKEAVNKPRISYWGRANISGILQASENVSDTDNAEWYSNESYIFLWNGSYTATISYFVNQHNFVGTQNVSIFSGDTPMPFFGNGERSTQNSAEWSWITWFGNNGGGDLDINETVNNQDFKPQFLDYYNPASVTTITGTYQQRDNITGTYNFTVDSNGLLRFNFSTGSYSHGLPVFHLKDTTSTASSYKDHIWYKNYSQSNTWQKLTNYTDFVIQDGNSTYFGYNYILLLINKTLGSDYEFWIDNNEDPPGKTISINLNVTKVWWNEPVLAYGKVLLDSNPIQGENVNVKIGAETKCSDQTNSTGDWKCSFYTSNEIGVYTVTAETDGITAIASLEVNPSYGNKPIGTIDRVVYEVPILIQDLSGKIRRIIARIIVWRG